VQSRHDFGAEVDEGCDRGDESDGGSGFSHAGDIDAHLSADDGEHNDIFLHVHNAFKQITAICFSWEDCIR
jgi:hypothetical protein